MMARKLLTKQWRRPLHCISFQQFKWSYIIQLAQLNKWFLGELSLRHILVAIVQSPKCDHHSRLIRTSKNVWIKLAASLVQHRPYSTFTFITNAIATTAVAAAEKQMCPCGIATMDRAIKWTMETFFFHKSSLFFYSFNLATTDGMLLLFRYNKKNHRKKMTKKAYLNKSQYRF